MSTGDMWSSEDEAIVLRPFSYLESHPGKDLRRVLVDGFNIWLQVPESSTEIIGNVISRLHSASLLIDDIEDSAVLRRGFPVAHNIYGIPQTINSANYAYFVALQALTKLNNPAIYQIFTEEMLNLHRGQGLELFWRDSLACPTEEEYIAMVKNKTGGLFRLAVRLLQAESPTSHDFVDLANLIGILYQIRDDYLNLQSDQYSKSKGFCEDLTEGKFSFPIIHCIKNDGSSRKMHNILKQHSTDRTIKEYAVRYMRDVTKSFDYTILAIGEYKQKIKDELTRLNVGPNPIIDQVLSSLSI
ncbi:isoprenoid synthase domain-containing protein [Kockiozyma suomiensis]|uniref:isoprenoid synthase domain-containing protein n=1 Tax=Kockiozyma suomiensis TaxID=1337062 RepID=UPI003343E935